MVFTRIAILFLALAVTLPPRAVAALRITTLSATGPQPTVHSPAGRAHVLYDESHALLISVSEYSGVARDGWTKLPSTASELDSVAEALRPHGFTVTRAYDPSSEDLSRLLNQFLAKHGQKHNVRLLVFFSGHGYTNPANDFGYLVPADAKDPRADPMDFYAKALPILNVEVAARGIISKHALFLFDSCFSGSIFSTKTAASRPEVIGATPSERWQFLQGRSQAPVRQFISAGSAAEILPGRSSFVPLLLHALRYGMPSQPDGYLTGKGLGLWIEQSLPSLTGGRQNPQSGVIQNPALAFGDMVFQIPSGEFFAPTRNSVGTLPSPVAPQPSTIGTMPESPSPQSILAATVFAATEKPPPAQPAGPAAVAAFGSPFWTWSDRRTAGWRSEDEAIETQAVSRINELSTGGHINVSSYRRSVLLTGEVPDARSKENVEAAVALLPRVRGTLNELAIAANSTSFSRSEDKALTSKVKSVLIDARDIESGAFRVVSERGVVYLSGLVTEREARRASELTRAVAGVQKVVLAFEIVSEEDLASLK